MASKVLQPIQKQTSAPVEEKFLQVQDVAHEEPQSDSFVQEEKTLAEKESEFKQKMGREESGKTDLEEEREMKRVEVEQSLDAFEKDRAKVQQKRVKRNLAEVDRASKQQLQKVRDVQKTVQSNKQVYANDAAKKSVVYGNDTLSNLISMAINDAIMNAGKDAGYEEDQMSEKVGLTGKPVGRQKTILVNGAMVTLDEDVANAITAKRSPVLGKQPEIVPKVGAEKVVAEGGPEVVAAERELAEAVSDVQSDESQLKFSSAELAYLDSEFRKMEQSLQSDRMEMERAFVAYQPLYYEKKYDYGSPSYGSEKPVRDLPSVQWGDVCSDYLPNGRRLPYVDYGEDRELQYG